ncbi:hypothetical protein PCCS19_05520 [Paenibacillus sp. CCS19]|nr:hypothetical protein PCCS19_05520 [Paenibacillus cellulosilyticus]
MPNNSWFTANNNGTKQTAQPASPLLESLKDRTISSSLEETLQVIQGVLQNEDDLLIRRFHVFAQYPAVLIYYSSMINQTMVNQDVMKPLMKEMPRA